MKPVNKTRRVLNQEINNETHIMMTQQTLTQLRSLKLSGMGDALQEQLTQPSMSSLSFEERLGLLVEREVASRDHAQGGVAAPIQGKTIRRSRGGCGTGFCINKNIYNSKRAVFGRFNPSVTISGIRINLHPKYDYPFSAYVCATEITSDVGDG